MPLVNLFVLTLGFFLFIAWLFLVVIVFRDIFVSPDLNGWAKALWLVVVLLLAPMVGVLIYLIVRGKNMHERHQAAGAEYDEALHGSAHSTAGGDGTADELSKLAGLHDRGHLTDDEYEAQKAKLLAS